MNVWSIFVFLGTLIVYSATAIDIDCGFEDDPGDCIDYNKCPQNKIKNLTFTNTYKTAKHCKEAGAVCCETPKANDERLDVLTLRPDELENTCPGKCLRQCPDGWVVIDVPTTTTTSAPNYGAFVIGERFSGEKLCSQRTRQCCVEHSEEKMECGRHNRKILANRIVGGTPADYAEFPWLVIIGTKFRFNHTSQPVKYISSGSLIAPNVVLTAAHTVVGIEDTQNLVVRAGDFDVQTKNKPQLFEEISIKKIIIHEKFDKPTHLHNIALVILDHPFTLKDNIGLLCLPSPADPIDYNANCLVAGWGLNGTDSSSTYQSTLKKATVKVIDQSACQSRMRQTTLGNSFVLHESFLCAIGQNGEDACKGDGGAPLVCQMKSDNSRYFQLGITSWGLGCGMKDVPGAYVDVSKFQGWISDKMSTT